MKKHLFLYIFCFALVCVGIFSISSRKTLIVETPEDYLSWYKQAEHLEISHEFKAFKTSARVLTPEYQASREFGFSQINPSLNATDSLIQEYKQSFSIRLRIHSNDGKPMLRLGFTSTEEYGKRLYYFTSLIQKDLFLITKSDTLACLVAHMQPPSGANPALDIIASFPPLSPGTETVQVLWRDHILDNGNIYFQFTDLSSPRLVPVK